MLVNIGVEVYARVTFRPSHLHTGAASFTVEGRCRLRINSVAENIVRVGGEVVVDTVATLPPPPTPPLWPLAKVASSSHSPSSSSLAAVQPLRPITWRCPSLPAARPNIRRRV